MISYAKSEFFNKNKYLSTNIILPLSMLLVYPTTFLSLL
jgi:hypothetical protein